MTESVLALANVLLIGCVLAYFYFREVHQTKDDDKRITALDSFYSKTIERHNDLNQLKDNLVKNIVSDFADLQKETSLSKDKLAEKSFAEYLKHIERLEKMVLPKPVTKKMVEEVLSHTPSMVENDIEKADQEAENENIMDILSRIPITPDTKVAFEGDVGDLVDNGPSEEVLAQ